MITAAKQNTIADLLRKLGREMNSVESEIFEAAYRAGHEDKADALQSLIYELEAKKGAFIPTPPPSSIHAN